MERRSGRFGLVLLGMTLLLAGCRPASATPPPTPTEARTTPALETMPPHPPLPPTPSPLPYPYPYPYPRPWPPTPTLVPTRIVVKHLSPTEVPLFVPTATPAPPPVVLGADTAPAEAWEDYVSTTVVVAAVGEGDGELGYVRYYVPQLHLARLGRGGSVLAAPPRSGSSARGGAYAVAACPFPEIAERFAVGRNGSIAILDKANHRVARFDAAGGFLGNTPVPDSYPAFMAIDSAGRICVYDEGTSPAGVKCYSVDGNLELVYPVYYRETPGVEGLRIDEAGLVWVQKHWPIANPPILNGYAYDYGIAPVGNSERAFGENERLAQVILGKMLRSGGAAIVGWREERTLVYNPQLVPIYQLPQGEELADIDPWGNLYTIVNSLGDPPELRPAYTVHKFNRRGQMVASFDIVTTQDEYPRGVLVYRGVVYALVFNLRTADVYRVFRWEKE